MGGQPRWGPEWSTALVWVHRPLNGVVPLRHPDSEGTVHTIELLGAAVHGFLLLGSYIKDFLSYRLAHSYVSFLATFSWLCVVKHISYVRIYGNVVVLSSIAIQFSFSLVCGFYRVVLTGCFLSVMANFWPRHYVMAGRPRGTTQVVIRGTTNDWYEVAGTRYCSYEVAAAGQSEHGTCHSTCVSTR
ncbi:hypothetical protein Tco_0448261 [Tanacetum coccineum]